MLAVRSALGAVPRLAGYEYLPGRDDADRFGSASQAGEKPLVILCPGKVDTEDAQEAQKWELLQEFLAQNAYEMKLDNGTYQIYE